MKIAIRAATLAVLAGTMTLITGCFGVFNGLGSNVMGMIKVTKSDFDPRSGMNPITYRQFLAVQDLAECMKIQIDWQASTTAEAFVSEMVPYGMAGAGGGSLTGLLYPGASALAGPAAGVAGVTYALGGGTNAAITKSYDEVYAVGDTIEKAMRDHERMRTPKYLDENGHSLFRNIHVTASFVRSRNGMGSPAPGLRDRMPDWHGAEVGK